MSAIQSIEIGELQRLRGITVGFEESGVTAIMGVNGSGKTTLLQALACVYRKSSQIQLKQSTYPYEEFFKPYEGRDWNSSIFTVKLYGRDDRIIYHKNSGKWLPRPQNRTERYVKYISISDCVPHQEREKQKGLDAFTKSDLALSEAKKRTLLTKVGAALHKEYTEAGFGTKARGLKEFMYVATRNPTGGRLEYPSHYMGAGEQKIIYVINEVLKAPKGSLVLIEELDISLHESAIRALVNFLLEQSLDSNRKLQIVFTTHWLGVQSFSDQLKIISLYENEATRRIVLRKKFDPQFIHNLSGDFSALRQIMLWVEDGLAVRLVEQVAEDCSYRKFVQVKTYGTVQNGYTMAGALGISGLALDRTLIVTDGDCYLTEPEKRNQLNNSIDGNGPQVQQWHSAARSLIVDLNSPGQNKPEKVLLDLCRQCVNSGVSPEWLRRDLEWIDQQVPRILDGKEAFRRLREQKGVGVDRFEGMMIQEASRAEGWQEYIWPLVCALNQVARNIGVLEQEEESA